MSAQASQAELECPHCGSSGFNCAVTEMWETRLKCVGCTWSVRVDTAETVIKNQQ